MRTDLIAYQSAQELARVNCMWLVRDSRKGYWLHAGDRKCFIEFLSDVAGWINYMNTWFPQ